MPNRYIFQFLLFIWFCIPLKIQPFQTKAMPVVIHAIAGAAVVRACMKFEAWYDQVVRGPDYYKKQWEQKKILIREGRRFDEHILDLKGTLKLLPEIYGSFLIGCTLLYCAASLSARTSNLWRIGDYYQQHRYLPSVYVFAFIAYSYGLHWKTVVWPRCWRKTRVYLFGPDGMPNGRYRMAYYRRQLRWWQWLF